MPWQTYSLQESTSLRKTNKSRVWAGSFKLEMGILAPFRDPDHLSQLYNKNQLLGSQMALHSNVTLFWSLIDVLT